MLGFAHALRYFLSLAPWTIFRALDWSTFGYSAQETSSGELTVAVRPTTPRHHGPTKNPWTIEPQPSNLVWIISDIMKVTAHLYPLRDHTLIEGICLEGLKKPFTFQGWSLVSTHSLSQQPVSNIHVWLGQIEKPFPIWRLSFLSRWSSLLTHPLSQPHTPRQHGYIQANPKNQTRISTTGGAHTRLRVWGWNLSIECILCVSEGFFVLWTELTQSHECEQHSCV